MKKYENGILIDMTAEEVSIKQSTETTDAIKIKARKDAETAATNKKASGKAKLKELGLDDDEIKALTGA